MICWYNTNFAAGKLQLSVGKLQLSIHQLFNRGRCWTTYVFLVVYRDTRRFWLVWPMCVLRLRWRSCCWCWCRCWWQSSVSTFYSAFSLNDFDVADDADDQPWRHRRRQRRRVCCAVDPMASLLNRSLTATSSQCAPPNIQHLVLAINVNIISIVIISCSSMQVESYSRPTIM